MKKLKTIMTMMLIAVFVSTGLAFTNVKVKAASGQSIVNYAKNFLGVPYKWGGTSPSGFDCSGLVQYVYNHFGVSLPRSADAQQRVGKYVSRSSLQPGDLVFFGNPAHHVGIYAGGGQFIEAPHTGANVRYASLSYRSDFSGGRRISGISNSHISIDGGGTLRHEGTSGMNLIIRNYSSDVVKAKGFVDSDSQPSWVFNVSPQNSSEIRLSNNAHKDIKIRGNNSSFTPGAMYKMTVKGYNRNGQEVCKDTIALRVPNGITNSNAKPIYSNRFKFRTNVQSKDCPYDSSRTIRTLHSGLVVDVYAEYGDWYLVSRGTPEWVRKSCLIRQ